MKIGGEMAAAELANRRNAALTGAGGVLGAGAGLQDQFGCMVQSNYGTSRFSLTTANAKTKVTAAYQGVQRLIWSLWISSNRVSTSVQEQVEVK